MNCPDGFADIGHLARPVRRDPLDVGILTQDDEHPAALGSYPDYADTRPRRLAVHAASLASACHGIVEGSLLGAKMISPCSGRSRFMLPAKRDVRDTPVTFR